MINVLLDHQNKYFNQLQDRQVFPEILESFDIFQPSKSSKANVVFIGKDTRQSSERLCEAVSEGIKLMWVQPHDFGIVTTPQLHWLTQLCNQKNGYPEGIKASDYIDAWDLIKEVPKTRYQRELVLDCANGVGAIQFKLWLEKAQSKSFEVTIINDELSPERLNEGCGAEFVHKDQKLPSNYSATPGTKCASFDGDADRLIYFYHNEGQTYPVIIDGDKQFALIVMYIKKLLEQIGVPSDQLSHVLVQTAYVNSRATIYLQEQGVNNKFCPTGVKNAHPIVEHYDIGANDEPNGHGTVVAKWPRVMTALQGKMETLEAKKLIAILSLSNMTVGDAIANLLLIESILQDLDMSVYDFSKLYEDNPNKMEKAKVTDRTKFKTIWDESRLTEPLGLQETIDRLVSETPGSKAFVRPSGTEDILRLYAEASTKEDMEALAKKILADIETNYKDF